MTESKAGHLEATTVALGAFTVLPGESSPAPAPFQIMPLASNPIQVKSQVGIELNAPTPRVRVRVVNALGRVVACVHDGPLGAGSHVLPLSLNRQPAGVYWLEATAGARRDLVKLVYVR
jgi:hypothetical protein